VRKVPVPQVRKVGISSKKEKEDSVTKLGGLSERRVGSARRRVCKMKESPHVRGRTKGKFLRSGRSNSLSLTFSVGQEGGP